MRVFGAALDPLDSPERINLKIGYLNYSLKNGDTGGMYPDPYGLIEDYMRGGGQGRAELWAGRIPVESWLTPRPRFQDLPRLSVNHYRKFIEGNGCVEYMRLTKQFLEDRIFPAKPVMIGVDHSQTAGVVMALREQRKDLNVIICDAHFDIVRYEDYSTPVYECGNFLLYLLDNGIIQPQKLWVIGVHETPKAVAVHDKWKERGVHVVTKRDAAAGNFTLNPDGPCYVSIDMDVGSLSSVFSARFMNCVGLDYEQFCTCLRKLRDGIDRSHADVLGLDVMELDIHFLEMKKPQHLTDYSLKMVSEVFRVFEGHLANDLSAQIVEKLVNVKGEDG